mmetsp:Transcript_31918/g.58040  ORF Transcript_31918/g.58040 Transcript_31918/m.58040 type:complete len:121 (+) Transcript_31918:2066-2428(+)
MDLTTANLRTITVSLSVLYERECSRSESFFTAMDSKTALLSNSLDASMVSHSSLLSSDSASSNALLSHALAFKTNFESISQVYMDSLEQKISACLMECRKKHDAEVVELVTAMVRDLKSH